METWAHGSGYEPYTGRWSRPVARRFIEWLDVGGGARWLVTSCGTGALLDTVVDVAAPEVVAGMDRSDELVDGLRGRVGAHVCEYAHGMELIRRLWDADGHVHLAARAWPVSEVPS